MSSIKVTLEQLSSFGTRGTGDGQFQYPAGSVVANNQLYIVDKQNNRIQYFTLAGVYVGQFGTYGTGNTNFSFPEQITTDGTYLYITDSGNHRIKKHDFTGTYIAEFGTRGSGDNQFDYPTGIFYFSSILIITDKQNSRIKIHSIDGTFLSAFNDNNTMLYPEAAIVIENNTIVVVDSGNKTLKYFTLTGSKLFSTQITFEYPVGISETDGILTVSDRQAEKLIYVDFFGNFIGSDSQSFNFNTSVAYNNNILYVVDSGDHEIVLFEILVEAYVPTFAVKLLKVTKQLYPTGRAWLMKINGIFEKLHDALSYSESRAHSSIVDNLSSILPDTDNFTTEDATRWEIALGLLNQTSLTLNERKIIIERKIQYPGDIKARQSTVYMQNELQKVGFNVYVYPNNSVNFLNPIGAIYGQVRYGQVKYGQTAANYTIIANSIEDETGFNVGNEIALRSTFFIGGENLGDRAEVDPARKNEFRELILKLKPAQSVGFLYVDYTTEIPHIQDLFNTVGGIDFATGTIVDSKSGFDATLLPSLQKNIASATESKITLNNAFLSRRYDDFTFFQKIKLLDNNRYYYFNTIDANIYLQANFTSVGNLILMYGGVAINTHITDFLNFEHTLCLTKVGTQFTCYINGIQVFQVTRDKTTSNHISILSQTQGDALIYCTALFHEVVSVSDIQAIGNSEKLLFERASLSPTTARFFDNQDGEQPTMTDSIQGLEAVKDGLIQSNDSSKYDFSMSRGFDLYTLDSNPTVKRYVPLKYDGTSFGKVITGYTYQGTYTQNGWSFLPCETKFKQPDEAALKSLDTALFYYDALGVAKEKSFSDFSTLPPYVSGDITETKIENLKILI